MIRISILFFKFYVPIQTKFSSVGNVRGTFVYNLGSFLFYSHIYSPFIKSGVIQIKAT